MFAMMHVWLSSHFNTKYTHDKSYSTEQECVKALNAKLPFLSVSKVSGDVNGMYAIFDADGVTKRWTMTVTKSTDFKFKLTDEKD